MAATKIKPTPEKFLEGIEMGMIPIQAAGYANYKDAGASSRQLLARPEIAEKVAVIRENIRASAKITRAQIEEGILDAISMARTMSDPLGMIRGYGELNKMQGNYAPEKKSIEITSKEKRIVTQFEDLDDQQLLELISEEGDELIIDAEFYEVRDGDAEET